MRPLARQQGFTLIEVAVAFAIFALSVGVLYESFSGAVRRTESARGREQAWLTALSLLSNLRASAAPWKQEDAGRTESGESWQIAVSPYEMAIDEHSPWRAYEVTVRVGRADGAGSPVILKSIELARNLQ